MKLTCIIVDDEELAREGLCVLLSERADVEILQMCSNGLTAIEAVEKLKPDLLLLDVQMPGINGFEVVSSLLKPRPYIVFVTAHDQYALKAFEVNAIDYLLKPFSNNRFMQALDKVFKTFKSDNLAGSQKIEQLILHTKKSIKGPASILNGTENDDQVIFKSGGQVHKVSNDKIIFVEAYDYYIKVHVENQFYLIRESMKSMTGKLPSGDFIRIHQSYLVNSRMIKKFGKNESGTQEITLLDGRNLKVSRNYKNDVQALFQ